jgi:hypothetical protein
VSAESSTTEFAQKVLESKDSELRRLVAAGLAPLPFPELLAIQVVLASDEDEEIAATARGSLREADPRLVAGVVRQEAATDAVLRYLAENPPHPVVTEAILQLRAVPRDLLVDLAGRLDAELQELLLFRQDAIVEEPRILDALAANPRASSYSERRIAEYREHLLPRDRKEAEIEEVDEDVDEAELDHIRSEIAKAEEGIDEDDEGFERVYRASEMKIRTLPVAARTKLARGATPLLRRILIHDQNPNVALSVMKFSPISESEVERICLSRIVVDDVLTHIANAKQWARRYNVVHALCQNPRTPINVGIRLLSRLSARHLLALSRNRNVADTMRGRALRLYRIKVQ